MGTRNFIQTAPTADNMALNAGMYGFAEAGLLTPHATIKQLWWTEERIHETVNRRLVVRHVRGRECEFLDRRIIYDTLTNDTYLEWIIHRAPRLFLTLVHIRCADRIFSLVDDGWKDEDLPVPREDVSRLDLSIETDEALNQRFYDAQFCYMLRQLEANYHIQYGPNEHIPMEYVCSMAPAVSIKDWHRIHFPGDWESTFVRRRFHLSDDDNSPAPEIEFLEDVQKAKKFKHEHIADVWASYTSEDAGYVLSTFVGEHTLRTFMDHRTPPQFMALSEAERTCLLLEWMHCLADTIAYLHHCNTYHGAIRPSNVLVDEGNNIAFSDLGRLKTFKQDKKVTKQELFEYSAPEFLPDSTSGDQAARIYNNPLAQYEVPLSWKVSMTNLTPKISRSPATTRNNSTTTLTPTSPPLTPPPTSARNFSRHLYPERKDSAYEDDGSPKTSRTTTPTRGTLSLFPRIATPEVTGSSASTSAASTRPTSPFPLTPPMSPLSPTFTHFFDLTPSSPRITTHSIQTAHPFQPDPPSPSFALQATDVFSLGTIYLELVTFLILGKTTTFAKFRKSKSNSLPSSASTTASLYSAADTLSLASTATSSRSANSSKAERHFFSDPQRVALWIDHLLSISAAQNDPSHVAVVELLKLVKQMLSPAAVLRPMAQDVRDSVEEILVREAGMEDLCCSKRRWVVRGEGGMPQAIKDRLWELRGPEREEEKRRKGEEREWDKEREGGVAEIVGEERERRKEEVEWVERMETGLKKALMQKEAKRDVKDSKKLEELKSHFSDDRTERSIRIAGVRLPFRRWKGPLLRMS
ncbi:hypothetical protein CAC42_2183 [Sphaceloma murrayae]|uniref:Protein kinase domain-containing protein n=1 Tax=Sphaceloma murrayae TaxID=2082308 RepID=A0A2K1QIG8_9PEZI|nr:hypothetical protein CAC42_2183 [Sphaceloma murrayae]